MKRSVRRVALLCLDPWQVEGSLDHRPFNYAVRRIQAAIVGHPELAYVEVKLIESRALDAEALAGAIEEFDPEFIGASAYVWSFPTLLEACRLAKRSRPTRTVVFGGPSARPEMFALPQHARGASAVDAIVVGDGEACIQELLLAADFGPGVMARIPGLALPTPQGWVETARRDHGSPDRFPSPYQLGLMPSGVTGQIESFRGCPLSCSYCEWGDTGVRPRNFGFEYLVRELQVLDGVDARGTWLVDPGLNLNSRAFQSLSRAEAEVGTLKRLGSFRCEIYPSHLKDEHLRFLEDTRTHYAGIGLQSFEPEVLKNVERPFDEQRFVRVVGEVASIVPDTVVEVILGLPGDSPDTFRRTLEKVRRLPVAVRVFHCLVLPSALMKRAPPSFAIDFDPFTLQMNSCLGWSRRDLEATCAWLDDFAESEDGEIPHGGTWKLPRPGQSPRADRTPRGRVPDLGGVHGFSTEAEHHRELRVALARHVVDAGDARLSSLRLLGAEVREGLVLGIETSLGGFELRAEPERDGRKAYRHVEGVAYSYASIDGPLRREALTVLERLIHALHALLRGVVLGVRPHEVPGRRSLPLAARPPGPSADASGGAAGAPAAGGEGGVERVPRS
jgi:radical SAM superfamily enzyme YgiQ (UPF0313 family)